MPPDRTPDSEHGTREQDTSDAVSGVPSAPLTLTAREAAERAGVHERTILRAIKAGRISATKQAGAYAIDRAALAAWQTRHQTPDSEQNTTPDDVSGVPRSPRGSTPAELATLRERVAGLERLLAERGERVTQLEAALGAERDAGEQLRILLRDALAGDRAIPATITPDASADQPHDHDTSASDRPGREDAAEEVETPEYQGSWLSVAWRRLTGRS